MSEIILEKTLNILKNMTIEEYSKLSDDTEKEYSEFFDIINNLKERI
jgi:hypothetical protein